MSKNIKLIAGAGLAVAAASTASVFNASAMDHTDIIDTFTSDIATKSILLATTDPTAANRNYEGKLVATGGTITVTRDGSISGGVLTVTDLTLTINGNASLDAMSLQAADGVKLHIVNNGTLTVTGAVTIPVETDITNNGTIYLNAAPTVGGKIVNNAGAKIYATAAFNTAATSNVTNNGYIELRAASNTISGALANNGTIYVYDGAVLTIDTTAMVSGSGKIAVLEELQLPADMSRVNGNKFSLEVVYSNDRSDVNQSGKITTNSPVDLTNRISIPKDVQGQGINGVTFEFSLLKKNTAGVRTYEIDTKVGAQRTVNIWTDSNDVDDPADATAAARNDNTKLREYIQAAFASHANLAEYLQNAGITMNDLTPADISYLIGLENADAENNVAGAATLKDEHGYKYNYFEGWFTTPNYRTPANLDAVIKRNETLFAEFSVRNRVRVGIGTKTKVFNAYDPADFLMEDGVTLNTAAYEHATGQYVIFAKQGQKFGDIKSQILAMLTAYNKANKTNYSASDILVYIGDMTYPELITTLIDGERYARLDNVLGMEVDDLDYVYILVGKDAKPAATVKPAAGAGATLASVKAPSTGAISEAAGSASSSNIFAVVAGAIVALGAAVAKLFKKSER
ncbi:MAG: hypothetical protein Q4E47_03660 [Candidatus Saccharibacteria bacterium]|nr:hypothetical protein [Candidatus Saccharibacteria bacterium]